MGKKILISGGARFHGLSLAKLLVSEGNAVYVLNRGRFTSSYEPPIRHVIADRNDSTLLSNALKNLEFDAIIDNNAYNAEQVSILWNILRERSGMYILTSSAAVYMRHHSNSPLNESDTVGVADELFDPAIVPYSMGKIEAEKTAQRLWGEKSLVLRFPNIFGEGDFAGKLSYFDLRRGDHAGILLEAEITSFSYMYVSDVVRCIALTLDTPLCRGIFNVAALYSISYQDFFNGIFGKNSDSAALVLCSTKGLRARDYRLPFAWGPPLSLSKLSALIKIPYTPITEWGPRSLESERQGIEAIASRLLKNRAHELAILPELRNV